MIISKTPYRISFFGGGSDFPSWHNKNYGLVISTSINKFIYISVRDMLNVFNIKYRLVYSKSEEVNNLNDIKHPVVPKLVKYLNYNSNFEIHYNGELPSQSGMGSSSAFVVGIMNAIINLFKNNLFLYFTGIQRTSAKIIDTFINKINNKKKDNVQKIVDIAVEAKKNFNLKSIDELGRLLHESWMVKKTLSNKISNSKIDDIYDYGMKYGALGGKVLGAGGGGFILFYVPKENHKLFESKLDNKLHRLKFDFENKGSEIIFKK